ncbi:MAG TPA: TolC family protein [Bacteroidales bacterium]|nr:TolC family protein [Bacteroidales bacterium]HOW08340.1 TolC family protein [Bacteroidales bacterium]
MKYFKVFLRRALCLFLILPSGLLLNGQDKGTLSLETAIEMALQNNHLLNVKKLQVDEKLQKVNEDRIKFLPAIGIGGSYQYNSSLPSLAFEQGRFGALPLGGITIPLPAKDELIVMGQHDVYNAGVTFYQPVTQLGKINSGIKVSKTELRIAETEKNRTALQIKQAVEKLYFGLLIIRKQIEEAELKVRLAESKLHDVENALLAGKTTESGRFGLAASVADEHQNLLKLKIQYDDYIADLMQLTGFDPAKTLIPAPVDNNQLIEKIAGIDTSISEAEIRNTDLKIASLQLTKAEYSIMAGKYSYLPDLGLIGGYTYQKGTVIYPENNTYIGASLKWNLQDILTNRTVLKQRNFIMEQAEENLANTREQVNKEIARTYRKLKQSEELISVAAKIVEYRSEDLRIKKNRNIAGLNLETELLEAGAALAKAESDYFSAQMNYRIVLSELKILTGSY